ncbi:acyltransferase family protein [Segatella copri]|uniref:acyltransferase family protein n=1 Tax=Segatella copri TaxID=165179 RepID=UPI0029168DA9|nr:acyltransferase family protein [Segatella copri]MDV3123247.1 acyltransferase family protein [Segatella copri]
MIEQQINPREYYLDAVKAIAIILTVLGHCIQWILGDTFGEDGLELFIYSFHMPLFMIISGYFFQSALRRDFKDLVSRKFFQLLIPAFCWTLIIYPWECESIHDVLSRIFHEYWFLKALFVSYIVTFVYYKAPYKYKCFLLLIGIFIFLIGKGETWYFTPMYPFFLVGIILRKCKALLNKGYVQLLFLCTFLLLLPFFRMEDTMYYTSCKLLDLSSMSLCYTNIIPNLLRYALGICGGAIIIILAKRLFAVYVDKRNVNPQKCILEIIGCNTLGIYLVHPMIYIPLTSFLQGYLNGYDWYIVDTACILMTVFVVWMSLLIIKLVDKSAFVAKFLLGKI